MIDAQPELAATAEQRRSPGWGGWLAIAGIVLFALGTVQIALAFDAMTVDQPGQWLPVYAKLAVMALLVIGLGLRWRVAYVVALGLAIYQLADAIPGLLAGYVGHWIFEFTRFGPPLMVIVGLSAAWRSYWHPHP